MEEDEERWKKMDENGKAGVRWKTMKKMEEGGGRWKKMENVGG